MEAEPEYQIRQAFRVIETSKLCDCNLFFLSAMRSNAVPGKGRQILVLVIANLGFN